MKRERNRKIGGMSMNMNMNVQNVDWNGVERAKNIPQM